MGVVSALLHLAALRAGRGVVWFGVVWAGVGVVWCGVVQPEGGRCGVGRAGRYRTFGINDVDLTSWRFGREACYISFAGPWFMNGYPDLKTSLGGKQTQS